MEEFWIESQRNIIMSYIIPVLWTECLKFYKSRTLKKKNENRIRDLKDYIKGIEGSGSGWISGVTMMFWEENRIRVYSQQLEKLR